MDYLGQYNHLLLGYQHLPIGMLYHFLVIVILLVQVNMYTLKIITFLMLVTVVYIIQLIEELHGNKQMELLLGVMVWGHQAMENMHIMVLIMTQKMIQKGFIKPASTVLIHLLLRYSALQEIGIMSQPITLDNMLQQ